MPEHRHITPNAMIKGDNRSDDQQTHLQMALSAAQLATWQWDPLTDALTRSNNLPQLYGALHTNALQCRADVLGLIHPEDFERHDALVMKTLQQGGTYTSQFRITRADNGHLHGLTSQVVRTSNRGKS